MIWVSQCGSQEKGKQAEEGRLLLYDGEGKLKLQSPETARVLVIGGEPINEPMANYGPFVMNTAEEIQQAIRDFESGKMGQLKAEVLS